MEPRGIAVGYNTISATGTGTDQALNLKAKGASPVTILSDLAVDGDKVNTKRLETKTLDVRKEDRLSLYCSESDRPTRIIRRIWRST